MPRENSLLSLWIAQTQHLHHRPLLSRGGRNTQPPVRARLHVPYSFHPRTRSLASSADCWGSTCKREEFLRLCATSSFRWALDLVDWRTRTGGEMPCENRPGDEGVWRGCSKSWKFWREMKSVCERKEILNVMNLIYLLKRTTIAIVLRIPKFVMLHAQCLDTLVNPCQHSQCRQVKNQSEEMPTQKFTILQVQMNLQPS